MATYLEKFQRMDRYISDLIARAALVIDDNERREMDRRIEAAKRLRDEYAMKAAKQSGRIFG